MDLRDILFLSVTTEQTKISVHIWSRPDAPWTAALQWAKKKDDEEETLQYKTVININIVLDTKDKTKTKTKAKQHEQNSKIEVGPTSSQPSKLVGENNPQLTVSPTELWSLWPWSDFVGTKLTIPLNSLLSCLSYLLLKNPWYSNTLLLLLLLLLLFESLFFIQVPPTNTTPIVSTTLPFYPSSSFSPIIVLDKIETITYKHTLIIIIIPIIRDFVVGFVWSGCCFAFLKFGRHGVGVSIIY